MNRTCLFLINGLGMGNSTRCHAVIEKLAEQGIKVHVLTSGNGLTYFEGKSCVQSITPMESLYYSGKNGGVSGWSTLRSLGDLRKIARKKSAQLEKLLDQINPDVAVTDSEYAIRPLRRRGIPIVALNTAEMVVSRYLQSRNIPASVRSQFWCVEFPDYLFHRHFCDLILSPFPLATPTRHRKFLRIGLIAREAVLEKARQRAGSPMPSPRDLREVVFMLSGSVHASNISFTGQEIPFKIHIVGRSGESQGNVIYHGRQMDNTELLSRADALVINGGYSAVSEAFVFGKPVFVVPVAGHAEQFVNANLVRDLGLGFVATESDVLPQLLAAYRKNAWDGLNPCRAAFNLNGAQEAADAIVAVIRDSRILSAKRSRPRIAAGVANPVS